MMRRFGHFIDGSFTSPSHRQIESIDPAAGTAWCSFSRGTSEIADRAIRSADEAFRTGRWAALDAPGRADCLDAIAETLARRWEALVEAEVRDNGKRIVEVRAQFAGLHAWFRPMANLARKIRPRAHDNSVPGVKSIGHQVPFGVVVAITPWNSPLMILAWKLAPALAAGNTVVVKPSELASASTLLFAEMLAEAGLPAGVLNVVTGVGHEVGDALVRHPLTRKITFTGSDLAGRKVAAAASENVLPTTLELGGKSPQVVFADADLDNAVNGILSGIFLSNGQTCVAGSRLIAERSVKDVLVERLAARARKLRMGNPMDPTTEVGPLANEHHHRKVITAIERAKSDGANCVLDGSEAIRHRLFVGPTIFDNVAPTMALWREEVFGPVLAVTSFDDEPSAIRLANDIDYGLAAGVWTLDAARANRVSAAIDAGTVYVNHYRSVDPAAPIGGMKRSGYGRELGRDALSDFLQTKAIWKGTAPVADPFPALEG